MDYSTVTAPAYANAAKTAIRCFVKFDAMPAAIPFVATADDPEEHGSQLFADLVDGKHGAVAPYAAPLFATVQVALNGAVQVYLDAGARSLGYDSIATAVTYADEPAVPAFEAQGKAFRTWRSLVWASAIATLDAAKNGSRPVPTAEELVATLPAFVAP